MKRHCTQCDDDGYVDLYDEDGFPNGAANCPDLGAPWHQPFNHTGILPAAFSALASPSHLPEEGDHAD